MRAAAEVVEPGGVILAASNAAKMSDEDFEKAIAGGIGDLGRRALITARLGQPADYPAAAGFPEAKYLKIAVVRVF
jgi:23S rRNA G2069 N7-methylase RlmK/C1962 C5-methylase RlmI